MCIRPSRGRKAQSNPLKCYCKHLSRKTLRCSAAHSSRLAAPARERCECERRAEPWGLFWVLPPVLASLCVNVEAGMSSVTVAWGPATGCMCIPTFRI